MADSNLILQFAGWMEAAVIFLGAYFIGCFATGYYLVRIRLGQDVRHHGSGNIGARNVGRLLGKTGFLITVLGDCGKGCVAVWLAQHFSDQPEFVSLAVLGVVAGHLWPVQLRFQGGKGVATSFGAIGILDFKLLVAFVLLFAFGFVLWRKTVLPGLLAFLLLPFASWYLHQPQPITAGLSVLGVLVLLAHRRNVSEEFGRLTHRPEARQHPPEL